MRIGPSAPLSIAALVASTGALYLFCLTTISRTRWRSAAAIIRSASHELSAIGFSTRTCFPARAAATAIGAWRVWGVQILQTAASDSRSMSS